MGIRKYRMFLTCRTIWLRPRALVMSFTTLSPDPEHLLDGHQRHHQDNHQHHHHLPQQYCLPKNQHNHHYDLVMIGLVCCHCPAGSCPLSHSRVTLPVTQADPENCRRSFQSWQPAIHTHKYVELGNAHFRDTRSWRS